MSLPNLDHLKTLFRKAKVDASASLLAVIEAVQNDLKGYVPTSRKVNSKPLSTDVEITAQDIGALGEGDKAVITTLTISTEAWNKGTKASITNALASTDSTYAFILTPEPGESLNTWQSSGVVANDPTATAFTFSCNSTPSSSITVNVIRIKAKEA